MTPTQQAPVGAPVVGATDKTPAQTYRAVAESDPFQAALVDAVRSTLAGVPHHARRRELEDAGVTAAEGGYATVLTALDRPAEHDRHQEALDTTARFGAAEASILGHLPLAGVTDGPLAALSAAEAAPTLAVRLSSDFRERPHAEREAVLSLLARLGTACDVRVVTTGLTARLLAREHRDVLPAAFSDAVDAHRKEAPTVDDAVEAARVELDPNSREVALLRRLAEEPGETLPYRELVAASTVSKGRVSQLLGDLEELDLVERYGPRSETRVELRPAGSAFVDALDAEHGRQAELDATFKDQSQVSKQAVVTPREHGSPSPAEADAADSTTPYRTRYCNRPAHHAPAAAAEDGAITAVEAPFDDTDTRTRWVSYNDDRDEVVVAVRATGALQYTVSTALSLASPRLFDRALPTDCLEAIDVPPEVLRDGRCIGGLSAEAAEDGQELRDRLIEWGEDLADMTTQLHQGDHERDRDAFRSDIVRSAHGLAGTIVHLLDVAGVDVVRELRVPRWLSHDKLSEIARAVTVSAAIQAEYSDRTLYRQVYERREDKRAGAFSVDVDAADPLGRYIGGLILRGPDVHRLARHVEGHLAAGPAPVHEEAPEIAIQVPVKIPDRSTYAETVARMGGEKNLDPTRDAVTILRTLTSSPYAVADALHTLGSEGIPRAITLDEVRAALGHLEADRLLPDAPPTVGKIIQALLRSKTALTPSDLAEAAGVSTASIHRHTDTLAALTLVEKTEDGLRFSLPTREERGEPIRPAVLEDTAAARQDLLFDVVLALTDDPPTDLLTAVFTGGTYDEALLRRRLPDIDPWVYVARSLSEDPDLPATTVTVGNPTTQTALADAGGAG
ncbi:helix-turn-helix domain-containing protein [Haloplanus natans]|uniref:helix-turn-helix domain-containing protein n=1 Tax=Haloplanus natans TaxID=376171 RepID=UPI000B31180A|nr:helix-turn-helix domain-containing protein [Haloplanus natans]